VKTKGFLQSESFAEQDAIAPDKSGWIACDIKEGESQNAKRQQKEKK
jgi:hypothetical protein